jgi:ATP-dependent DNA ligase
MPRLPVEIRLSESIEATAAEIVQAVKQQGLEGVVAKRRDSRYESGKRSGAWVKMRVNKGQGPCDRRLCPERQQFRFGGRRLLRRRQTYGNYPVTL